MKVLLRCDCTIFNVKQKLLMKWIPKFTNDLRVYLADWTNTKQESHLELNERGIQV